MAAHGGSELERGEIDVAGVRRSYWLARAPRRPGQPALSPAPQLRVGLTLVIGTEDRTAPYEGGPLSRRWLPGLLLKRRAAKHGELPGEDIVVGADALMINWAGANGITTPPAIQELDVPPGDLSVTRKAWAKPGAQAVTLYRINGGGHGWPGGPQFLPARVIGPIGGHLDATALLLELTERETAGAGGRRMLGGL